MTTVQLELSELLTGAMVGVLRQVSAIQHRRPAAYGAAPDDWTIGINGTIAEMVIAKYLGRYWESLAPNGDLRKMPADVGACIQVRSTPRPNGCLIVHERDRDDDLFYLVITAAPRYDIVGWTLGKEAKRNEFWRADGGVRHPAFFVPQDALSPCNGGGEALFH